MADPLRPQFFVTRQNGNMVPLIAMDELPSTVNIRHVSRNLSPYDVSGMTGVGTFNARHRQHVLDTPATQLSGTFMPETDSSTAIVFDHDPNGFRLEDEPKRDRPFTDKSLMASSYACTDRHLPAHLTTCQTTAELNAETDDRMSENPTEVKMNAALKAQSIFPQPPKTYGIEEQAPAALNLPFANAPSAATLRLDRNATGPATLPPWHDISSLPLKAAPGVKEYCSYWLRHGECDYAQQGCLYRHEMPLDQATLQRLGLRDIPRWYREKHGLGSYLAGGTMSADVLGTDTEKRGAMERNWRAHFVEDPLEEERRKTEYTSSSTNSNMRSPPLTPPSTTSPPRNGPVAATANGHRTTLTAKPAVIQRVSISTLPHTPGVVSHRLAFVPVPVKETAKARQTRETIAALDAYDLREKERKLRAAKYTALIQERRSLPMSSAASSGGSEEINTKEKSVDVDVGVTRQEKAIEQLDKKPEKPGLAQGVKGKERVAAEKPRVAVRQEAAATPRSGNARKAVGPRCRGDGRETVQCGKGKEKGEGANAGDRLIAQVDHAGQGPRGDTDLVRSFLLS